MIDAMISRARLRDPACLGRYPAGLHPRGGDLTTSII
jgi:hypothetical protein